MPSRVLALFTWTFAVWVLLTWTLTVEMMLFGVGLAAAVAVGLAPLGPVSGPWLLLRPRRLTAALMLMVAITGRIIQANLKLSRLIWHPRLTSPGGPLRTGMIIVPTRYGQAGQLTAVGLITSLIVDNQIIDLDPSRRELQYHAVQVPAGGPHQASEAINAPVERRLAAFTPKGAAGESPPRAAGEPGPWTTR